MKGLSPVIAVVLMVAVAVAAAVLAFIWAMGIQTATQAKTRERADAIINNQATIEIVSVDTDNNVIFVRNIGNAPLNGTWYVFVNDSNCATDDVNIAAQAVDAINASGCTFSAGNHVKVVGPNGAEAEYYIPA